MTSKNSDKLKRYGVEIVARPHNPPKKGLSALIRDVNALHKTEILIEKNRKTLTKLSDM